MLCQEIQEKIKLITLERKYDHFLFLYVLEGTAISRISHVTNLGVYINTTIFFTENASTIVGLAISME